MHSIFKENLKSANGWSIPCFWNVGKEHKMILVCLHGFAGSKESAVIAALMEHLDEKGIGVVAFDWPAHGDSDASGESLTVENCLRDLNTVIEWVRQRFEIPIACFATSFGGYLATLYRNERPQVFLSLILRSPALKMNEVYRGLLTDEEFAELMQGKMIVQGFGRKMKIGKGFYDSLCRYNAYSHTPPNHENMLIIQGDADSVVNPKDTKTYAEKNKIKLILFEGADHFYGNPGERERIVAETERFLFASDAPGAHGTSVARRGSAT